MSLFTRSNSDVSIYLVILVIFAVILSVVYPGWWTLHHRAMDLPSYYVAGNLVLNRSNPYHPVELGMAARSLGLDNPIFPYIYFPMIALIFIPLTFLNYTTVQIIWFLLSQAFFWLSLLLIAFINKKNDSSKDDNRKYLLSIIAISCFSYPLIVNYQNGQINTAILFLLCSFIYLLVRGTDIMAGVSLGLVCMIKPQPLILIPYLIFKRKYKCTTSAVFTFVFGTISTAQAIGWDNFLYYLKEVMPTFSMVKTTFPPMPIYVPVNQSIHGLIYRLLQTTEYSIGLGNYYNFIKPVASVIILLILLISAYKIREWNKIDSLSESSYFRDISFLILTSIILSPITWEHHFVVVVIAGVYVFLADTHFKWRHPKNMMLIICWVVMMLPLFADYRFWGQTFFSSIGMSLRILALLFFWAGFSNNTNA